MVTISRREFLQASAGLVAAGAGLRVADAEAGGLPPRQLRALRAATRGPVYSPGVAGYDRARVVFNRRFDAVRPPAVVRVRDREDVRAVVRWANRYDVPLVGRSGGNAYNGGSTSRSAVVVDVGALDAVRLGGSIATVGPGARNLDLYAALARRGAAVPSGSCPNVAVGGLVLNGGMGLAGRSLGLTLDRVTGFDVVTAEGTIRHIDRRSDEELFWALRGGGGSFALVTAVHLRVRHLRSAAFFQISYPASAAAEVLAAWDALAPTAPRALTSICTLSSDRVSAFGQYLGSPTVLRQLVRPLTSIGGASVVLGTDDFLSLQRRWAGCAEGESVAACRSVPRASFDASSIYVEKRLSERGRRAFVAATQAGATLVCDAYGGAINAVPRSATAFVHRDVRFSVQILSYAPIATARARVRRARALIAPYGNGAAYQNYPDLDLRDAPRAYWGTNLERLRRIKAAADPEGRFVTAQGVRGEPLRSTGRR